MQLFTVQKFAERGPFTEAQLRWMIFNASTNGLAAAGAIVRIGRRVYLDAARFEAWIADQQQAQQQVAA